MMEGSIGRAGYVGRDHLVENDGIPNPGALGLVSSLKSIESISKDSQLIML